MGHDVQFLVSILAVNATVLPAWFVVNFYTFKRKKNKENKKGFLFSLKKFIFVEYFICLIAVTIIPLPFSKGGSPYLNLDFFHQTYNNFLSAWNHTSSRTIWSESENIIGNVLLFFPMGFLLPLLYPKRYNFLFVFIVAFSCSFLIEAIQYYVSIKWGYDRVADIDDLTLNILGTTIGFFSYKIFLIVKPNSKYV